MLRFGSRLLWLLLCSGRGLRGLCAFIFVSFWFLVVGFRDVRGVGRKCECDELGRNEG